jgi:hypothetical protein
MGWEIRYKLKGFVRKQLWPHLKYHSGGLPRGAEENYKKSVRMAVNEPTFEHETPQT